MTKTSMRSGFGSCARSAVVAAVVVGAGLLVGGCSLFGGGGSGAAPVASWPSGSRVIQCESRSFSKTTCPANVSEGVRLVRQISGRCEEGRSWGVEEAAVWVDFGCSGEFELLASQAAGVSGGLDNPADPNEPSPASATAGLDFGSTERNEAVLACASYADFKAREAGAIGAQVDRVIRMRRVDNRHYQVQGYIRGRYDREFLRSLDREDKPRPRPVFYIDCETVQGQVIHFEYNNFL